MAHPTQHRPSVRNGLLAALSPEDWAHLEPHLERVELPFDQTIHAAGGPVDAVFFVETGMVSLIVTLEDGEQVEAGVAGSEGLVGLPLVYGNSHSVTDARVQMEGTALRIEAAAFRAEMDRSAAFRAPLLRYALAFHAQVSLTAACNARHAVENRLARWLLIAHDRAGQDEFPMTHEFISMMLGVRRPSVTIAAGILHKAGLIHYARGRMEILDQPGLEAASCECYHIVRHEFARLLGPGAATPPG
ncbi:Crp/Fnr family transcriptional regulator [Siccirubricoccus sp. G192]|uniref:Crp/Fnr family transcriptional regulator n=1 Tax=Siccirubricoccus sp. G192 TaxID=2849651 RepID=UPI001C2C8FA3|nr:Crp/Fnr family transcriptional regulator [Siccirubricoccus sp. G192]MBV1798571.1 Crp/Fnr family transcriptional regulator [Siccirubricoccus sp. G192]